MFSIRLHSIIFIIILLSFSRLYAGNVQGVVSDLSDNAPVYPAYITVIPLYYVLSQSPLPVEPPIYAVINNPDGSYMVEDIPTGDYFMICSAQLHKWQRMEAISLTDQEVKVNFSLEKLDPAVNNLVSGIIYQYPTRGLVVPLVNVYLTNSDPNRDRPDILYQCLSDGFGHYQFYDLYSGWSTLQFSKPGYELLTDRLEISTRTWLTNQDYWIKPLDNIEPIVLHGYVLDRTIDRLPVHPAHIRLYTVTSAGEQISYDTVNNPDGSYLIRGIKPGTYKVICTAMGYEKHFESNLILSEPRYNLDFYLKPLSPALFGYITGHVHFDRLKKPVTGALISFIPKHKDPTETSAVYQTQTDLRGNYKMMLPEGVYIVSCQYRGPDGWYLYQEYYDDVHRMADALPVKVKAGDVVTGIDFGIPYPAIVSNVTVKGNVSDQQGNALANALVNVYHFDHTVRAYLTPDNAYQTRTDDQGNYILEINLYWFTIPTPVLGFIVSACKDGYQTEFYKEKKTAYEADILWAFSDTTFAPIDFTLNNLHVRHAIKGTISSESREPIFQAFVIGVHAASGEVAFTVSNDDGTYLLSGLKEGYYFLLFIADGYIPEFYDDARRWEKAKPLWVDGVISNIDAVLSPMPVFISNPNGIISGRIYDQDGNPLSGAMVTMQLRDGPLTGYRMSDNEGMFQIPWENAGDYMITISKVNYSSYDAWITVNAQDASSNSLIFTMESTVTYLPDRDPGSRENTLPAAYRLYRNYPNPFNPLTHIPFDLPEKRNVSLVIYDILGHRVRELFNGVLSAGTYTYMWDGTDQRGQAVSSGIYFYVLQTLAEKHVGKMILQK